MSREKSLPPIALQYVRIFTVSFPTPLRYKVRGGVRLLNRIGDPGHIGQIPFGFTDKRAAHKTYAFNAFQRIGGM